MSDISKCTQAEECKLKHFCYRFTAQDGHWQSWANMSNWSKSGKTCHNQIKVKCDKCEQTKVHKMGCQYNK